MWNSTVTHLWETANNTEDAAYANLHLLSVNTLSWAGMPWIQGTWIGHYSKCMVCEVGLNHGWEASPSQGTVHTHTHSYTQPDLGAIYLSQDIYLHVFGGGRKLDTHGHGKNMQSSSTQSVTKIPVTQCCHIIRSYEYVYSYYGSDSTCDSLFPGSKLILGQCWVKVSHSFRPTSVADMWFCRLGSHQGWQTFSHF